MNFDIIIIGSGPAGYIAAIKASKLGFKTAIVEKNDLGGICLNWGCIPTKSLLKSVEILNFLNKSEEYGFRQHNFKDFIDISKIISRSRYVANTMNQGVDYLMKKNNIRVFFGTASFINKYQVDIILKKNNNIKKIYSKNIVIATGGSSKILHGIVNNGINIIDYKNALSLKYKPKTIIIIGAGAIGIEFAYFYASLGVIVTLIEYQPNILPNEDIDISLYLESMFKKRGIKIFTSSKVESVEFVNNVNYVYIKNNINGLIHKIESELVFTAIGTLPNISNLGLEGLGINIHSNFINVDNMYQTNVQGYYAIGDVINTPALAHVASSEAGVCIDYIKGLDPVPINYSNIPSCVYSKPEVASVGYTEHQAIKLGYDVKIGKFPFIYSGKANADGDTDGFIKVIFDSKYDEWLGCHMIGNHVTEIISEVIVARNLEATGMDILNSVHPHPTLSECLMEAVADAYSLSMNK